VNTFALSKVFDPIPEMTFLVAYDGLPPAPEVHPGLPRD